ncbi:hypothetical protein P3S67_028811 [Capsicum chacoense]
MFQNEREKYDMFLDATMDFNRRRIGTATPKKTIYAEQASSLVNRIKECSKKEHECKSFPDINVVKSIDTSARMDAKEEAKNNFHIDKLRRGTRSVVPPRRIDNWFWEGGKSREQGQS